MKRIIKLTENDLTRIVRRVIKENEDMSMDEYIDWNIKSVNCEGKDDTGSMRVSEDEDGNPTVFIRYCKGDDKKLDSLKRKARHEIGHKSLNEMSDEEGPKFKHRLGWKLDSSDGPVERWYDEGDHLTDDFEDYDEEMVFGPDDYEKFTDTLKGVDNRWNPPFNKHYYGKYTQHYPLKLRKKSY